MVVIVVWRYYNYLGVVFLDYYYCECFCLVIFGLFSCTDKRIYWFSIFLWFVLIFLLFLSTFDNAMSMSTAIVTPLFE